MINIIKKIRSLLWDGWCAFSILGIWPRYVEPRLLKKNHLFLEIPHLSPDLQDLKILHFSDLHFHSHLSNRFLNKILKKVHKDKPDVIVFTGDFICYSELKQPERLQKFLNAFHATYGCYCIFGNHDYQKYVTLNREGNFDIRLRSSLFKGIQLLLKRHRSKGKPTLATLSVPFHDQLCKLLETTPFCLLENKTQQVAIKSSFLNICGLGDLWLGRCHPEIAFKAYCQDYPGIVLTHNPESFYLLKEFPGEIILAGHTHGEQIHFPGFLKNISKRMAGLAKDALSRGFYEKENKKIYVTRGVGCHKPFRLCSIPEILLITLKNKNE